MKMAFINKDGKSISYECSALIKELKTDIKEFGGDKIVVVWCKESEGVTLYTNYDFIDEEDPVDESDLKDGEFLKEMTMSALLVLLEKQNEIF
jgi:hypothetical protein